MSKRPDKSKTAREPRRKVLGVSLTAFEETKKLYDAWLGYLLTLIEADTLRVKASDITSALDRFTCTVTREGEEYVIHLERGEEA